MSWPVPQLATCTSVSPLARMQKSQPVRVAEVQEDERFAVRQEEEPTVMSFPHLVLREAIALLGMSLFLVVLSLVADAPLEEIANSSRTPNPAKAPWYFLGLQELLHYYPPFVAGVLLPGIVVMALVQIPYFDVNLKRTAFWTFSPRSRKSRTPRCERRSSTSGKTRSRPVDGSRRSC